MKGGLIIFIVLCTFVAAMVPRDRRAVATDDMLLTTEKPQEICAPETPCAWSIYKPVLKRIEINITNSYCTCKPGTFCKVTEDDDTAKAYVLRCRYLTDDDIMES